MRPSTSSIALAFDELRRALDAIKAAPAIKGVLITSAKEAFIVGADIFEFTRIFKQPEADIAAFVAGNSAIITALDDLPVPTVAAINGLALGGGLEVALAADYRVMSSAAKIGVSGDSPGPFPRLWRHRPPATPDRAWRPSADWIISGAQQSPDAALEQARSMPSPRRRTCARPRSPCLTRRSRAMPIGKAGGNA